MAILTCPECGQKISDEAVICDNCGFNMKKYKDDIYSEIFKDEIEYRASQMRYPKIKLFFNKSLILGLILLIITVIAFLLYKKFTFNWEMSLPLSDWFLLIFFLMGGCVNTYIGAQQLIKVHKLYHKHKQDEEQYKKEVARFYLTEEMHEKYEKRIIKESFSKNKQSSSNIKCPYCNSYSTKKITVTTRAISTQAFGMASSKIGKQWHCNDCNSDF